ncbi:hypothetical protein RHMOL_Rhmol05G0168600 [Rhododendron molle]|uniref:Uncharacterized protein n=1 Tax=Rhododendron molle TaxID=49168 RepID=A0ACC0NRY1_RHOML|nr:hypothetical protein RHMOL_Rhmol05G0168600 [Rhododendron molle]
MPVYRSPISNRLHRSSSLPRTRSIAQAHPAHSPPRRLNRNHKGPMAKEAPIRTLRKYLNPKRAPQVSPIVIPTPTAGNAFDFKVEYLKVVPEFQGRELEDPYSHIWEFETILHSFTDQGQLDQARLKLFPFSL